MNPADPLDSVYFIKLPNDFKLSSRAMQLDSEIPLPVQRKDGEEKGAFDIKELTQEQVLSGILTVLAYDRQNENLDYYRKVITEARPGIKKELAEAAILKTKNEDWELAEEIWLALHGLDPEDKAIILNMALFYDQRADNYRKNALYDDADAYDSSAEEHYRDVLDSDDDVPDAFFNAGFFYLKKHDFSEAKSCFDSYLALMADTKEEELGENDDYKIKRAQEILDKIKNRKLENERFHKAYELISTGRESEGLVEIRRFLQDNPAVWNAWFLLGWGLRRLEQFSEAKMAFEKARECEGGDESADTLNELAICQMETGDLDGAQESLVDALNMDPDNTKVISNLGFLSLKKGNAEEARKFFLTVLEIDSKDSVAAAELKKLEQEA
ncbi:MAG: tetratricopeptide repeat protein [Treponema sp.]|nr:tetratricopeptide repeat protein [Treponema sp.]